MSLRHKSADSCLSLDINPQPSYNGRAFCRPTNKEMSIKVIVTAVGQHVIADIKQIENKESEEVVGYWLETLVIAYSLRKKC